MWTPDGRRLAFASDRGRPGADDEPVLAADANGVGRGRAADDQHATQQLAGVVASERAVPGFRRTVREDVDGT